MTEHAGNPVTKSVQRWEPTAPPRPLLPVRGCNNDQSFCWMQRPLKSVLKTLRRAGDLTRSLLYVETELGPTKKRLKNRGGAPPESPLCLRAAANVVSSRTPALAPFISFMRRKLPEKYRPGPPLSLSVQICERNADAEIWRGGLGNEGCV